MRSCENRVESPIILGEIWFYVRSFKVEHDQV